MERGGERAGIGQPARKPRHSPARGGGRGVGVLALCFQAGQVRARPWAAAKSPSVRGWPMAARLLVARGGGLSQQQQRLDKIRETEAGSGVWDLPIGPRPYSNPILQRRKLRGESERGWVRGLSNRELQDTRSLKVFRVSLIASMAWSLVCHSVKRAGGK